MKKLIYGLGFSFLLLVLFVAVLEVLSQSLKEDLRENIRRRFESYTAEKADPLKLQSFRFKVEGGQLVLNEECSAEPKRESLRL